MNESMLDLAVDYPLLNMFWTMMMIFLWVLWFMLLFRIIGDIFRDDGLGGWGKARGGPSSSSSCPSSGCSFT